MGFISISFWDILDIFIVSLLIAQLYRLVRGTSAYYSIMAIFMLYIVWVVVRLLNMELISSILGQVLGVGVIALLIVFQQEVRRFLLYIGNRYFVLDGSLSSRFSSSAKFDDIVLACENMSATLTGALIVFEQKINLDFVKETGDKIDSSINQQLLETIFFKNTPLHDGAIVITNGRISHARCVLPTTENSHIPAYYGMRHRAAIGVSESSDAVVVVVSEQSGKMSFVAGGKINRGITSLRLKELMIEHIK